MQDHYQVYKFGSCRPRLVLRKQIVFSLLTFQWLHAIVSFIYGPTRNVSLPFTRINLPTTNQIGKLGKNFLGFSILDTWIRREGTHSEYLITFLSYYRIDITEE